jgi:hypothetical protein
MGKYLLLSIDGSCMGMEIILGMVQGFSRDLTGGAEENHENIS